MIIIIRGFQYHLYYTDTILVMTVAKLMTLSLWLLLPVSRLTYIMSGTTGQPNVAAWIAMREYETR